MKHKFDLNEIGYDEGYWYHAKMMRELGIMAVIVGIVALLVVII